MEGLGREGEELAVLAHEDDFDAAPPTLAHFFFTSLAGVPTRAEDGQLSVGQGFDVGSHVLLVGGSV